MYSIFKEKVFQYFQRILFFLVIFYVVVLPVQSALNQKIIAPIIIEKLDTMGPHLSLHTNKNHTVIRSSNKDKGNKTVLRFSIPFGQFYFFLIFFLWFKPPLLITTLSLYNIILIPAYVFAVFMFLKGHEVFGYFLMMNEKIFRIAYFSIFFLKIFRPNQFKLIFSN